MPAGALLTNRMMEDGEEFSEASTGYLITSRKEKSKDSAEKIDTN